MEKSVLRSKTFWFGVLTALTPLYPPIGVFVSENTQAIGMIWGTLAILLRAVTKSKIVLRE